MKRTFLGTVTAINPTETSGFVPGCHAVSVRVDPVEMGRLTFTTAFHFPHEETRDLGTLFGKSNAVRITVEAGTTTTRIPTRDTAQVGEYYERNCKVYLRSPKGGVYDDLVAEAFGLGGLKGDAYEVSCVGRAQRIAALLSGAAQFDEGPRCGLCGRSSMRVTQLVDAQASACEPCARMHAAILDEEYALPDGEYADSPAECLRKMWLAWIRRSR